MEIIILLYSYLYNKMIKTKTRQFNISSKGANNGSYKSDITISLTDLHFNEKDITNVLFSPKNPFVCIVSGLIQLSVIYLA